MDFLLFRKGLEQFANDLEFDGRSWRGKVKLMRAYYDFSILRELLIDGRNRCKCKTRFVMGSFIFGERYLISSWSAKRAH